MASALRPLRLPGFPNLGLAYFVNELGNWLGRDRARDPRLRPDRQPDGDRGAVLRHALRARAARARRWSPGSSGSRSGSRSPASTRSRASRSRLLALIADSFALAAVLALADVRRLARLRLAGADPGGGHAPCSPPPASCARATRCSTSPSRSAPPAGRRSPGWWSPAPGSRPRCSPTPSRSWPSRCCSRSPAGSSCRRPRSPRPAWTDRLRRGLAYVRERPALRRLLGAQALAFIFFSLVIPIEVVFAKETLDAGDAGLRRAARRAGASGWSLGSLAFAALRRVPLRAAALRLDARDRARLPRHRDLPDAARRLRRLVSSAGSATASSGSPWSPRSRS